MTIELETIWLPRPSSKYKGSFPLYFEERIPYLLETKNYIHLFSGMAKSGHTVDINPNCHPMTIADAECLPFPNNYFDGGFADPPYNQRFAKELYNCKYPKFNKWTSEMVRVVKPLGKIAIMQNYIVPRLKDCHLVKILVVLNRIKHYPKIVTIQSKFKKCVKQQKLGN